jgi:dihydroorotase
MSKEIIIVRGGFVDSHTHLREPGATQKEDFQTGTMAAIAGGYTAIIDMPNNPNPTISKLALQEKTSLAQNMVYCDIGFHFGVATNAKGSEYFEDIKDQVFGLKIYMNHTTGPLLVESQEDLDKIFSTWTGVGPILVHAEGDTLQNAINLSAKHGKRLHACHISTAKEIQMIIKAKEKGLPVTCEVTPHHLFLTEDDVETKGPFAKMRPPLGSKKDQQALWANLDIVDTIASDHAPHTIEEKLSDSPPYGIPGLETTLPLLLTSVADGRLSLDRLIELTSINPRKIFGIPKMPETYTQIDLSQSYIIDPRTFNTKAKWTPFEGMRVKGKIVKVVLRGNVVFDGENVIGSPVGQVIFPGLKRE